MKKALHVFIALIAAAVLAAGAASAAENLKEITLGIIPTQSSSDLAARRAGDVTFVADGGNVVAVAAKSIQLSRPGRWLDPGPLGCLGVGAPFALAAKILAPERPVMVIQGDGSFGLNGFDFETAVRFKLPMVVVVATTRPGGRS